MDNITEFGVDRDEFYQGFVKSTSMKPTEAFKELEQNMKQLTKTHPDINLTMNINFQKDYNNVDATPIKGTGANKKYIIEGFDIIVIEDNSPLPMSYQNGIDSMTSLKRTSKGGGIGCFNFGEVLAMSVLTQQEGSVIYYNKKTTEEWCVIYPKNSCPILQPLCKNLINILNECKKSFSYNDEGTVKIIIPNERYDFELNSDDFTDICEYIDLNINGINYSKWIPNETIMNILLNKSYKFKFNADYYIEIGGTDEGNYVVNLLKYERDTKQMWFTDNISSNGKPKSEAKKFKKISKHTFKLCKQKCIFKVNISSLILPKDHYFDKGYKNFNNLHFNVLGFLLDIKKPDEIIRMIYPNSGGNASLKNTFTIITISGIDLSSDDKNTWIKKNIFNFYPDKLKSGDPIINWKYIKNYIKNDMELFYTHITSNNVTGIPECFAVRNRYFPGLDNKMWELIPQHKDDNGEKVPVHFKKYMITNENIISDSDSDSDSESEDISTNISSSLLPTTITPTTITPTTITPTTIAETTSQNDMSIDELIKDIYNRLSIHEKNDIFFEKLKKIKELLQN